MGFGEAACGQRQSAGRSMMHLRRRSPSCFGLFKSFGPTRSETTFSQKFALCRISLQMTHYAPTANWGSSTPPLSADLAWARAPAAPARAEGHQGRGGTAAGGDRIFLLQPIRRAMRASAARLEGRGAQRGEGWNLRAGRGGGAWVWLAWQGMGREMSAKLGVRVGRRSGPNSRVSVLKNSM